MLLKIGVVLEPFTDQKMYEIIDRVYEWWKMIGQDPNEGMSEIDMVIKELEEEEERENKNQPEPGNWMKA